MHTLLTITALRLHGNVESELKKKESLIRADKYSKDTPIYPFSPIFYPIDILSELPSSKNEALAILNPLKETMQKSLIQPSLGSITVQHNWVTAELDHPCLEGESQILQIAQFPPLYTRKGFHLSFFRNNKEKNCTIEQDEAKNLRVFTLSVLSFSWSETDIYSFSWGEIAHTWLKIDT